MTDQSKLIKIASGFNGIVAHVKSPMNEHLTLCGLADDPDDQRDYKPQRINCKACVEIMKYCKTFGFSDYQEQLKDIK